MNSPARASAALASAGAAALALATLLGGCADIHRAMETPRVNPESPVAPAVAAGADRGYPYPLLRDVPPVPKNLPEPAAVKTTVGGLVTCRRAMAGYVVDHPPLSGEPAAFAEDARAIAEVSPADVPPPDSAAKAEADAARLRAEAAPPVAINSGPPPTAAEATPGGPAPGAPAAHPAKTPPHVAKAAPAKAPAPVAAAPVTAAPVAVAPPPPTSAPSVDATPALPAPLADPLLARCS